MIATLTLNCVNAASFYVSNLVDGSTDILFQQAGASNAALLDGGVVTLGYFANGYTPSSSLGSIATTIADFTIIGNPSGPATTGGAFASALTNTTSAQLGGSETSPGYVDAAAVTTISPITVGNALIGRTLYMFVGNSTTLNASTAFALQAVGVIADDVPNANDYFARPNSGVSAVIGQFNTNAYTGNPFPVGLGGSSRSFDTFQLQAIPEPSSLLLVSIGVLALLRRRR